MIKNPFDLIVYEEILWEIRPNVVIEIGNAFGGFTLWLLDRLRLIGVINPKIITIDLEKIGDENIKEARENGIISLVGNCNSPEIIKKVKSYIEKRDKVLIIEDSSHTFKNTLDALENYSEIVSIGSYFIIEDGICDILDLGIRPGPKSAVETWIKNNDNFKIDRKREKYIMTYNPKGYLLKLR
jgi:cephalosporin hydroxylase